MAGYSQPTWDSVEDLTAPDSSSAPFPNIISAASTEDIYHASRTDSGYDSSGASYPHVFGYPDRSQDLPIRYSSPSPPLMGPFIFQGSRASPIGMLCESPPDFGSLNSTKRRFLARGNTQQMLPIRTRGSGRASRLSELGIGYRAANLVDTEDVYQCDIVSDRRGTQCGKKFATKDALGRHQKSSKHADFVHQRDLAETMARKTPMALWGKLTDATIAQLRHDAQADAMMSTASQDAPIPELSPYKYGTLPAEAIVDTLEYHTFDALESCATLPQPTAISHYIDSLSYKDDNIPTAKHSTTTLAPEAKHTQVLHNRPVPACCCPVVQPKGQPRLLPEEVGVVQRHAELDKGLRTEGKSSMTVKIPVIPDLVDDVSQVNKADICQETSVKRRKTDPHKPAPEHHRPDAQPTDTDDTASIMSDDNDEESIWSGWTALSQEINTASEKRFAEIKEAAYIHNFLEDVMDCAEQIIGDVLQQYDLCDADGPAESDRPSGPSSTIAQPTTRSDQQPMLHTSESNRQGKHKRGKDDDDDDSEDEGPPKGRRNTPRTKESSGPFACPIWKHSPFADLPSACKTSFPSVSRVKEHLYRAHLEPVFCDRCKTIFASRADLRCHSVQTVPCEITDKVIKGLTVEQERKIRAKTPRNTDERSVWISVYKVIFGEDVPSVPNPEYIASLSEVAALGGVKDELNIHLPEALTAVVQEHPTVRDHPEKSDLVEALKHGILLAVEQVFARYCSGLITGSQDHSSSRRKRAKATDALATPQTPSSMQISPTISRTDYDAPFAPIASSVGPEPNIVTNRLRIPRNIRNGVHSQYTPTPSISNGSRSDTSVNELPATPADFLPLNPVAYGQPMDQLVSNSAPSEASTDPFLGQAAAYQPANNFTTQLLSMQPGTEEIKTFVQNHQGQTVPQNVPWTPGTGFGANMSFPGGQSNDGNPQEHFYAPYGALPGMQAQTMNGIADRQVHVTTAPSTGMQFRHFQGVHGHQGGYPDNNDDGQCWQQQMQ